MMQVVCALLTDGKGRWLLGKRATGRSHAGLWEFAGGKVEPGESHAEAIRRELKEELAIEVSVVSVSQPIVYPDGTILLIPIYVSIDQGTPTALDHETIAWYSKTEMHDLPMAYGDGWIRDHIL